MQRQIPGLKGQINIVGRLLKLTAELEVNAPQAKADAPFPVRMTAKAVNRCLAEASRLLRSANDILAGELAFYVGIDEQIAAIQTGEGEESAKSAQIEALNKSAQDREADTAGEAIFAMQSLPAALVFLAKAMENDRTYRGTPPQGKPHKQVFGLTAQLNIFAALSKMLGQLEQNFSPADEKAPFPVKLSAQATGLCLADARRIVDTGTATLTGELDFYSWSDSKTAAIQNGEGDEADKTTALEALKKETDSREPLTAGRAVHAMQSIAAALAFMAKAMEGDRTYRS